MAFFHQKQPLDKYVCLAKKNNNLIIIISILACSFNLQNINYRKAFKSKPIQQYNLTMNAYTTRGIQHVVFGYNTCCIWIQHDVCCISNTTYNTIQHEYEPGLTSGNIQDFNPMHFPLNHAL